MERNIFIFDQNKCVGCHACVVACMNENGFQTPEQWRNIHKSNEIHTPNLPLFYLSLACNHCDDAPCLKNCPALAYSRDKKTGAIIHHPEKCIGCKYCTWACPYDAPKFNPKTGVVEKCTFCNHRIEDGLKPACANLCPVGALDFVNTEFSREESALSSPVPVNVGSGIKIKRLRKIKGPEIDSNLFTDQPEHVKQKVKKKITAREEWPLLLFTLLSALLVSIFASGLIEQFSLINKLEYIGFGALAALLSMLHLGRKLRAWRSLLNIKNSWLSREILLFSLFFASVFIDFFIFNLPDWIVSFTGILLLFAIDMLYRLAHWRWTIKIHSAQSLLIALTFYAFFTNSLPFILVIAVLRLLLYGYRKLKSHQLLSIISTLRISLLILAIVLLYLNNPTWIVFATLLTGELIDRIEFYNELEVPNPATEFTNR
ncbi:MAG: DmsC/YnfH family molybdoenzyme membrane anchor subunit [Bacteroidales bacterium]|nr:DmsC/YnfH family molybdoenzyme membrane anchor subunit [Bacteroidales bacterium]